MYKFIIIVYYNHHIYLVKDIQLSLDSTTPSGINTEITTDTLQAKTYTAEEIAQALKLVKQDMTTFNGYIVEWLRIKE